MGGIIFQSFLIYTGSNGDYRSPCKNYSNDDYGGWSPLVIDLNGDGQVTQSKEMAFGEWTTEQDTDLQALAKVFDSNGDGTFDSRDARFNEFRIWKDANSNGVADAGEMVTLQAAGIAANDALYWWRANV